MGDLHAIYHDTEAAVSRPQQYATYEQAPLHSLWVAHRLALTGNMLPLRVQLESC